MCDYTIESLDSFIMATCFLTKTGGRTNKTCGHL